MNLLTEMFRRASIDTLIDEQLYDAQRQLLAHEAAAEHHAALAEMYRRRTQRLMQGSLRAEIVEDTAAIDFKSGRRLRA